DRHQAGAEQDGWLAAAMVSEPPGEGSQQQSGEGVGADHDADRDVARVERAVHVAGQDGEHRADRDEAAEGDREDARERDPGPVDRRLAFLPAYGAHLSNRVRSSITWSGGGSAASASSREQAPLRTRIVARPARRPPSTSEEILSPTMTTRSA